MTSVTTNPDSLQLEAETAPHFFDHGFDPIEVEVRDRARQFIEELIRGELDEALARPRYGRSKATGDEERAGVVGHRHGSRERSLTGTFAPVERDGPRARLNTPDARTTEWRSQAPWAYQRRTLPADALTSSGYLRGTNALPTRP